MTKKDSENSIFDFVVKYSKNFLSSIFHSSTKEEEVPLPDFELLNSLHSNSPTITCVYNHKTLTYDYFSPNIKDIMGYNNKTFQEGGLKFAMSLVHPDHTKIFNRYVLPVMFKYYSVYALKRRVQDIKFTYTFKIRRSDGEYIWALHNMNAIRTSKLGLPSITVLNISDITELKKDDNIDISILIKGDEGIYKPVYTRVYRSTDNTFTFSERELEIMSLLSEGKTSKQIAYELNISPHTVISHRKNMMQKCGAKNSSELIHFAFNLRLPTPE